MLEALKETKIELLRLPTYAPWTNPVEKVWRKLSQEVLTFHDLRADWERLKAVIIAWLSQWAHGSQELLHCVGLAPTPEPSSRQELALESFGLS